LAIPLPEGIPFGTGNGQPSSNTKKNNNTITTFKQPFQITDYTTKSAHSQYKPLLANRSVSYTLYFGIYAVLGHKKTQIFQQKGQLLL
jgi:hypothetical protein